MAGVVKAVEKGEVASTVKIEITKPSVITAMITKEAVDELGLKEGDKVEALPVVSSHSTRMSFFFRNLDILAPIYSPSLSSTSRRLSFPAR
jgi:molybdate transport system regulatory protein